MPIDKHIRETVETFTLRVQQALESQARTLTDDLLRAGQDAENESRAAIERAVAQVRTESERVVQQRLDSLRAELTRDMDHRLLTQRDELESAHAALTASLRDERAETLSKLLDAIRQLDDAKSLRAILEILNDGAAALAGRAAILMVERDRLRAWGQIGFPASDAPADLPVTQVPALAAAVSDGQTSFIGPDDAQNLSLPPFMRLVSGHTGLTVPIVVGTEVVAVLYADDTGRSFDLEGTPAWTKELEVLARHASLRLASITSMRTVELLSTPV